MERWYALAQGNPYKYTDPTGHNILDALLTFLEFKDSTDTITESDPQVAQNKAEGFLVGTLATFGIALGVSTVGVALLPAITVGAVGGLVIGGVHTNFKNRQLAKSQDKKDIECIFGHCRYDHLTYALPQTSNSPTLNNLRSQANNAFKVSQNFNPTSSINSGGSYLSGIGYVTSEGKFYPTANKDFKPGTGNRPYSPGKEIGCKLNCAKILRPPSPKKSKK